VKKWLCGNLLKALLVVLIVTLLVGGVVYAYQTIWSGKVRITIEPAIKGTAENIEVTKVVANQGTWNNETKTWTVSVLQGDAAYLVVYLTNTGPGNSICQLTPYIDNKGYIDPRDDGGSKHIAPGVGINWFGGATTLKGGTTDWIQFGLHAEINAQTGLLPEIGLEIRK